MEKQQEIEKDYRYLRNLVLGLKDLVHLEDVFRLMAQSNTEFIKLDNIRADKQHEIDEKDAEYKRVTADTNKAKQEQSGVLGRLSADYVKQEEAAKVSLTEIQAKGSAEQAKNDKKIAVQLKTIDEKQAVLDDLDGKIAVAVETLGNQRKSIKASRDNVIKMAEQEEANG